jgi:DNA-binding transcriptional ArsR family regulator
LSNRRNAFVAISDPTRREILELLRDQGSVSAGEIASSFKDVSRPGISRHLRILKECGVVSSLRDGKTQNYTLRPGPLVDLREGWLAQFSGNQIESLARLRKRVESRGVKKPRL